MKPQDHYNYDLQVWIVDGFVKPCDHLELMRLNGRVCCRAWKWAGMTEAEALQALAAVKALRPLINETPWFREEDIL